MALGVVSFALTTLISMMPIGLNIFRDSIQSTVRTDVLRELSSQFQETPFAKLSGTSQMLYFSDQGTSVTTDADAFLAVSYVVTSGSSNPTPFATAAAYDSPNLKTAVVSFFSRADRAKSPQTASMTNVLYLAPGIH